MNGRLISDYDFTKITESELNVLYTPTSVYLTLSAGLKLPRLIPWSYWGTAVTGLPLTLYTEWYGESGTTSKTYAELLLFGFESQFGVPLVNLYLARFGIKGGYQFDLTYDTLALPSPDVREFGNYLNVLRNAAFDDYIYLTFETVLTPVAGFLTRLQVTAGAQLRYYLRKTSFGAAAVFSTKM